MVETKYLIEEGEIIAYNMEQGGVEDELVMSSNVLTDECFLGMFLDLYKKELKNYDFILLENDNCIIELEKDSKTKEFKVYYSKGV